MGASLVEAVFGLAVFGLFVVMAAEVVDKRIETRRQQQMGVALSEAAFAASELARTNFVNIQTSALSSGGVTERSVGDLKSAGLLRASFPATDNNGERYRIFFGAQGTSGLEVLVTTEGAEPGTFALLSADTPHHGVNLGMVMPLAPTRLTGAHLDAPIALYQKSFGLPSKGKNAAFVHLSPAAVFGSALYRREVPGRSELNRMEAPINMDGNDLANVQAVKAQTMSVEQTLSVTGNANFLSNVAVGQALTAAGDVNVTGQLQATAADVSGTLTAAKATVTGATEASGISVTGTVTATNMGVVGDLKAKTVQATTVNADTANIGTVSATGVTVEEIVANRLRGTTSITADTGVINNLTVGSCTGC